MNAIIQLKELYAKNSKHSNYQILSDKLTSIIGGDQIDVTSRYEHERLDYILRNVQLSKKNILDIGGNSGFFTFESLEAGAEHVHHYEGNKEHSDFVKQAAEVLKCDDKVEVTNGYYAFEKNDTRRYDVVFLLNVLHHLGDDFGDNSLSISAAKELMSSQLNDMASKADTLVFQLGFCWKGNRNLGLFEHGTKSELIDFVKDSAGSAWDIRNIGVPEKKAGVIHYTDLNASNALRDDSLGEFLNRPLFIMDVRP